MITDAQIQSCTEKIFSRSSGPGGQHVNKTSTKVQLTFPFLDVDLDEHVKSKLLKKYPSGKIQVSSQDSRSQKQNIEVGFIKLQRLIQEALRRKKKRKPTRAPHLSSKGKLKKKRKEKLQKYRKRYLLG